MRKKTYVQLSRKEKDIITRATEWREGDDPEYRLGEDDTIVYSADFGNGVEMDIKCCGVQYEYGSDNSAWCEAVLFDHGTECAVSDVEDDFFGTWKLCHEGVEYVVEVVCW